MVNALTVSLSKLWTDLSEIFKEGYIWQTSAPPPVYKFIFPGIHEMLHRHDPRAVLSLSKA